MKNKNTKPDSVTYNILISSCCRMSKYDEAIHFFKEMVDLKIPLSEEIYSSMICAYSKQGQLVKAETLFNSLKGSGCCPDLVTYTAMINAYSTTETWEKACSLYHEMETNNIQLDSIACSALMKAYNKGNQASNVLTLAEIMKEKGIPFNDANFFEMLSACSTLRDWRKATDIIKLMEPSLHLVSVGTINHLLHFLGKSGKMEIMMKLFYRFVALGSSVNISTYSILLKNLLSFGNWRKYIEVLQWMDDAGIQPSNAMYNDILYFAQNCGGAECAAIIKERVESLKR